MGLIQKIARKRFYFFIFLVSISPVNAFAGWSVPQEIIQGSWGAGVNQFGITHQDTEDFFPDFIPTTRQKIVIRDGTNDRVKIYNFSGALELIVPYKANLDYRDLTIADSYGFSGDFVGYGEGDVNYFYRADQKVYIYFSPTGQLIKTSTSRPLELGIVSEEAIAENQYKISIKYPDKTYKLTSDATFEKYIRDAKGNIYAVNDGGGVWRFNQCGKQVAELIIAPQQRETMTIPKTGQTIGLKAYYGGYTVTLNGDVYAWKKTNFKYSILKWSWVDDPNAPIGPDAPTNLAVAASINGLYLTWTASPQDPGCVTGYEIARATTSGGVYSSIATVDKGVLKYNDTSASAGTTYFYKIRAMAGSDYSPYTSEVSGKR